MPDVILHFSETAMISCRRPPKAQQLIARNVTASDRNTPIVFSKLIKTLTPRENTNPAKGSLPSPRFLNNFWIFIS